MAVITFDIEKNSVSVLVEKNDVIHIKEGNVMTIQSASKESAGKIFVNDKTYLCMVRGERG